MSDKILFSRSIFGGKKSSDVNARIKTSTKFVFTFAFVTSLAILGQDAIAAAVGRDCKPKGIVATAKEAIDSKTFWIKQLKEIQDYVDGQRLAYQLSIIERRRSQSNLALDAEEMRAMKIPQYIDPQLERELRETDRALTEMDREMLQVAISWGEKCTAYAKQKLVQ